MPEASERFSLFFRRGQAKETADPVGQGEIRAEDCGLPGCFPGIGSLPGKIIEHFRPYAVGKRLGPLTVLGLLRSLTIQALRRLLLRAGPGMEAAKAPVTLGAAVAQENAVCINMVGFTLG